LAHFAKKDNFLILYPSTYEPFFDLSIILIDIEHLNEQIKIGFVIWLARSMMA
jgi:putative AlgH/UPF0301 family transcriptional regulator